MDFKEYWGGKKNREQKYQNFPGSCWKELLLIVVKFLTKFLSSFLAFWYLMYLPQPPPWRGSMYALTGALGLNTVDQFPQFTPGYCRNFFLVCVSCDVKKGQLESMVTVPLAPFKALLKLRNEWRNQKTRLKPTRPSGITVCTLINREGISLCLALPGGRGGRSMVNLAVRTDSRNWWQIIVLWLWF